MRPEIDIHFDILQRGQAFTMKQLEKTLAEPNPSAAEFLELMKGYAICSKMFIELVKGDSHERMGPAR